MDETLDVVLEHWIRLRKQEEWLVSEIVKTRGTKRSALKRMRRETTKMLKKIERQLFNG